MSGSLRVFRNGRVDPMFQEMGRERTFPYARAVLAVALLGALSAVPNGAGADALAPAGGTIAFVTDRPESGEADGDLDIFVKDVGSATSTPLVTDPSWDTDPAWSPDGKRLAFSSDRGGEADIWVVSVATGAFRQVVGEPGADAQPAWSADGKRIAFVRNGRTIRKVSAWGGSSKKVVSGRSPAWSPTGRKLAYVTRTGTIKVRNLVTGKTRKIGRGDSPAWSPNGKKIAFRSFDAAQNSHIYVARLSGGVTQVTHGDFDDWEPAWAPGGGRITFSRDGVDHDIYAVTLSTGAVELLVGRPDAYDVLPSWRAPAP